MTRTGVSCFTLPARSRSSSSSGKGSGFCTLGSQPVRALVRYTPARSVSSSDRGASSACMVSPTCRWETTKGAGMISNPNTLWVAARLTCAPVRAPMPLPCRLAAMRRSASARYVPVPQQGSRTKTLSAARPSAIPRSSFNAISTRATM